MSNLLAPQEVTIDFSLQEVKEAINKFHNDLRLDPDGYYKNRDNTNDMMNIYAFNIWKTDFWAGSVTGDMRVTLHEVDPKRTKVIINSIAKSQGPLDTSRIMDVHGHFLNKLTQALKGEYVSPPPVENSGCLGVVLVIIALATLIFTLS